MEHKIVDIAVKIADFRHTSDTRNVVRRPVVFLSRFCYETVAHSENGVIEEVAPALVVKQYSRRTC